MNTCQLPKTFSLGTDPNNIQTNITLSQKTLVIDGIDTNGQPARYDCDIENKTLNLKLNSTQRELTVAENTATSYSTFKSNNTIKINKCKIAYDNLNSQYYFEFIGEEDIRATFRNIVFEIPKEIVLGPNQNNSFIIGSVPQ